MNYLKKILLFTAAAFGSSLTAQEPRIVVPTGHTKYIRSLALSGDEKLLLSVSEDGYKVWSVDNGMELLSIPYRNANGNMGFPIGKTPHIGLVDQGQFMIVDGNTLSVRKLKDFGKALHTYHVVTDPQGRYAYIGAYNYFALSAQFIQMNLQTGVTKMIDEVLQSKTGLTGIGGANPFAFDQISVSPDGNWVTGMLTHYENVADRIGYSNILYNVRTGTVEKRMKWPGYQRFIFLDQNHVVHFGSRYLDGPADYEGWGTVYARLLSFPQLKLLKTVKQPIEAGGFSSAMNGNVKIDGENFRHHYAGIGPKAQQVVSIDLKQGKVEIKQIPLGDRDPGTVKNAQLLSDAIHVIYTYPTHKIAIRNIISGEERNFGAGQTMNITRVSSNPLRPQLAICSNPGKTGSIQLVDLRADGIRVYNYPGSANTGIHWSPKGDKAVYYDDLNKSFGLINADSPETAPKLFQTTAWAMGQYITWSPTGKLFAHHGSNGIKFVDATTLRQLRRVAGDVHFANMGKFNPGAFSADGSVFVAYILQKNPADEKKPQYALICYDVNSGTLKWNTPITEELDGLYVDAGINLISAVDKSGVLRTYSLQTGAPGSTKTLPVPNGAKFVGQNEAGNLLTFWTADKLLQIDRKNGTLLTEVLNHGAANQRAVYLTDNSFSFFTSQTTGLKLIDWKRKADVASLVTFRESNDYGLSNRQNYFEASEEAQSMIYLVKGSTTLSLQSLFEKLYTPRLLNMILQRTEPGPPVIPINTIKPAPRVAITYRTGHRNLVVADDDDSPSGTVIQQPQVTIHITASAPNDKVVELRLFHNGKRVSSSTRNLVVADDDATTDDKLSYQITLQPGVNQFTATALNSQRTESPPARLTLTYQPTQAEARKETPPTTTLWLVVVGINQYKNSRYNLNYALADAKGFEGTMKRSCGKIIQECNTYLISDGEATKAKIIGVMQEIAQKAQPQDMLVFYYAGHGVMSEGAKPDFFLVPHDVTQLYGNDAGLASRGISSGELQKLSAAVKAQKQLFVLDACQSAGALQAFAMRGAAEEKAIAQLARSTGTHWLTASGSDQFATEFDKLGHGAFTYVLLQGLRGEAALSNGAITVNSLKAYIEAKVPEITEQYKGTAQYPASYGFGMDFPLGTR